MPRFLQSCVMQHSRIQPVKTPETTAKRDDMTDVKTIAAKATIRCQFCASWNKVDVSRAADRPKCGKCGKPMLLDRPLQLDDESFARTIAGSAVPEFADFHADLCGPCKMMAPAGQHLA